MDVTPSTADVQGNIASVKFIFESPADGLSATAGGGQSGAAQLTTELSRVTTVATAGDSVMLPPAIPGLTLVVTNHGANPMQVYGTSTDTVNDVASGTGVSQMDGSEVIYVCYGPGKWYANGLGTGYAGSFETQSTNPVPLTAHAGGGQANGTPITTMVSVFGIVASAGDSGLLPVSVRGMTITVINKSATSMNVFPQVGDQTNGSANAAVAVTNAAPTIFYCIQAGAWVTK